VAVIVTPGIKAFVVSETIPPRVALLVWLKLCVDRRKHNANAVAMMGLVMVSSSSLAERNT